MAVEKKFASAKRFGSRYGRRIRHKVAAIESEQRKSFKCPYCSALKATRVSTGIWSCSKCCSKFTGKAYSIPKKAVARSEQADNPVKAEEEAVEETEEEELKPSKYKEAKKEEPVEEQGM